MKFMLIAASTSALMFSIELAYAESLPPLPPLPGGDIAFNPLNPLGNPTPALAPIAPEVTEAPNAQAPAPDLPALPESDFEFFQPGAQLGELPPLPEEPVIGELPAPQPTVEAPKPKRVRNPHARPFKKRFDYKIQQLPTPIYSKSYDGQNRHLPIAQHETDYDQAAFAAAAGNDINGLRAMLTHGRRPISLRNAAGETLLDVAIRHRAPTTQRYLMALGAPRS